MALDEMHPSSLGKDGTAGGQTVVDPVCGMTVEPHTARHRAQHAGHPYYFCSAGCKTKFEADPAKYLEPGQASGGFAPVFIGDNAQPHGC